MDALPSSLTDAIAADLATFVAREHVPGVALAVVVDGQVGETWCQGLADRSTGAPMHPDSLFRIASLTKTYTATAVLQVRDEGRLRLDDPLVRHVPEAATIRNPFGPIEDLTIRRLLTHTAGLQSDAPVADPRSLPGITGAELLARLDEVRAVRPAATGWHYSNVGYELLVAAVERVTGTPWTERLQRCVLDPAGLRATTYLPDGATLARLAVGEGPVIDGEAGAPASSYDSMTMLGAGGLWASAADVAHWLVIQSWTDDDDRRGTGGRIIDGPTLREMQRPAVLVDDAWQTAQGMGWALSRQDGDVWRFHTGSLGGFRAIALFRPDERVGVVMLTNGSARPNAVAFGAGRALLAWARGRTRPGDPVPRSDDPRRDVPGVEGVYEDRVHGRSVIITTHGGVLHLRDGEAASGNGAAAPLSQTDDPGRWVVAGEGGLQGEACWFVPGPAGAVDLLNLAGYPYLRRPGATGATD